jgi:hypothetical protein
LNNELLPTFGRPTCILDILFCLNLLKKFCGI